MLKVVAIDGGLMQLLGYSAVIFECGLQGLIQMSGGVIDCLMIGVVLVGIVLPVFHAYCGLYKFIY
jgi:hypothetical protein